MLYRLFGDCKHMYIYLTIHQEYGYLGNKQNSLYFPFLRPAEDVVGRNICTKQNVVDSEIVAITWSGESTKVIAHLPTKVLLRKSSIASPHC